MEVRRTAVVKLVVSDEQRDALHTTAEQYLHCANRTAEFCWDSTDYRECRTHKRNVRDALYDDLRDERSFSPNSFKRPSGAASKLSRDALSGGRRAGASPAPCSRPKQ